MNDTLTVVEHPLIQHKLTLMREVETSSAVFRQLLREISTLLAYEVLLDLELTTKPIRTPLTNLEAPILAGKKVCFVSILRAGNGLLEGMLDLVPFAPVGHIGLYREPDTLQAIQYYLKLPNEIGQRRVISVDPMLAIGNSAVAAVQQLKQAGTLVRNLGADIGAGRIRNANLINQYTMVVRRERPELAELTAELAKEGTTKGLAYTSLLKRSSAVNLKPRDTKEANVSLDELWRIEAAVDPEVFNDSLIDVINVLADLSNGKLARLHLPNLEPQAEQRPGSHLVGNPRYGEWRSDPSGNQQARRDDLDSFWVFYRRYALMRDLFFYPRTYYYRDWASNRGWSYYGNIGRHYYGTRSDMGRWNLAGGLHHRDKPQKSYYGPLRSQRRQHLWTVCQRRSQTRGFLALRETMGEAKAPRPPSPMSITRFSGDHPFASLRRKMQTSLGR